MSNESQNLPLNDARLSTAKLARALERHAGAHARLLESPVLPDSIVDHAHEILGLAIVLIKADCPLSLSMGEDAMKALEKINYERIERVLRECRAELPDRESNEAKGPAAAPIC